MSENTQGGLSEAEQAYFDSEGATHFEVEDNAETQAKTEADKTGVLTDEEARIAVEGKNDDEEGVRDEKGRFVNYGALHKERSQRKELEQEVSGLKQFKAAMEEKMRWTEALLAPGTEQKTEEAPPDPDQDIFAALKYEREKRTALEAKLNERDQTEQQSKAEQEHENNVWSYWHQSAAAYKAETADFDDAVKWMSAERTRQLSTLKGLNPQFQTEAGIVQQINAELKDIVVAAAQAKISPAEYIYNMAKEWGYKGAAPVTEGKIELPGKLKNVEQAQERSRTVAQGSGKTEGADEISIDSLAAMPQGEFNEWMKVPANAKTFQRLMGG